MNTQDGTIYQPSEIEQVLNDKMGRRIAEFSRREIELQRALIGGHIKEMAIGPTSAQLSRGKVGRNESCPCGSGKKFKHCCLEVAQ